MGLGSQLIAWSQSLVDDLVGRGYWVIPLRVRSLCSIMSTTGAPFVGLPTLEAAAAVIAATPTDPDEAMRIIGSRTHQATETEGRLALAAQAYHRMFYPEGARRQFAAIVAAPNRTPQLRQLSTPTLVVHGGEDSLINISGGKATADAIPDARYLPLDSMGHDLPTPPRAQITAAIDVNAQRAG
jgi:pimeloyl-ACP methyl ester carboxylesterase